MSLVDESQALHDKVQAFAAGEPGLEFDQLALELAQFQARFSPGFRRLLAAHGGALDDADRIPAVPTAAFRLTRVAVHPEVLDSARFATSGTTGSARGLHAFRSTDTYRRLALAGAEAALFEGPPAPRTVVALAVDPGDPGESSLGFMMRAFMRAFDPAGDTPDRWLMSAGGIELAALAEFARTSARPLMLLATSFACVALLDALGDAEIPLPAGSVVMQTGGFKGRTREVDPRELGRRIARAFALPLAAVVTEYGMTELSSQLYDATLRGGAAGVLVPPRWLRVTPVDPVTLEPAGEGIARFVDLGNVDSAVAIVTEDRVRRSGTGIELLGRDAGATPRGCSLAVEALLTG